MNRSRMAHVALAATAIVAASLWLGVATSTAIAVAIMVLYALQTWRTA